MVPFSFSFCVYILCRRSGGQGLCRANTFQRRGRAVRRGLAKSSSPKPSPSPTDALKRLMHDDAGKTQDPTTGRKARSPLQLHMTRAQRRQAATLRGGLETRALSSEPSKVFIPGADCFPGACVMIASAQCDTGGGWVKVPVCAKSWSGAVSCGGLCAPCLPKSEKGRCTSRAAVLCASL